MAKIKNPRNARHLEHNNGQGLDIARKGNVAKRIYDALHHPHMSSASKSAAGLGGMGHAVTPGTPGAAPLPHAFGNAGDLKTGTPAAPPVIGHRSRTNSDCETHGDKIEHGRDMLSEAVKN